MAQRMVPCPHCKSPLPEHASFCPYCAQSVRPRRSVKPPSHLWGKALRWGLGVCLALAAVAAVVVPRLPKTYDAYGEVLYTDADGTYQLLLSTVSDRFTPMLAMCFSSRMPNPSERRRQRSGLTSPPPKRRRVYRFRH